MSAAPGRQAARCALGALALTLAAVTGLAPDVPHASAVPRAHGLPTDGPPPASAAAAQADLRRLNFGVRLVDVPLDEKNNPLALHYIIDALSAGSVIRRRIMIINDEPRTAHFTVYPGAATNTGGKFSAGAGDAGNELTSWISVQQPSVTVGPVWPVIDWVTIRVPFNATPAKRYGVVWVQQAGLVNYGRHATIREVARVGIRVYLTVRPGLPPTRFTITSLTGQRTSAGQPMLFAHVQNTGARTVDLTGQLRLTDGPGGWMAGPFSQQRMVPLAPGKSGTVVFVVPAKLPDGPWTAAVTLVGGLNMATARARIVFGVKLAPASWTSGTSLLWGAGLLLGALVIAVVIIAHSRRPRRGWLA
ncbi:MAG TPA: hypothetical protein VMU95_20490 [Trebonia sp.]|nr:hypothetical protein [Trebonia sp.]